MISSDLPVNLPIGTIVTNAMAVNLSHQLQLNYLIPRILQHPELYRSWIFDGVSGVPDWLFRFFGNRYNVTYYCALPHDLGYAYGQPGNSKERKAVDKLFYHNLVNVGDVNPLIAKLSYYIVRVLGHEKYGVSYTWGFADKRVERWSERPLPWTY